jgi:hypothetical protein
MFRFDSFKKSNEQDSSFSFLQRITSNNNNGTITSSTSSSSTTTSNSNNSDKQKNNTSIPIPVNSWGMLVLSQLQNQQEDFIDIINILTKNSKVKKKKKRRNILFFMLIYIYNRPSYSCLFQYPLIHQL